MKGQILILKRTTSEWFISAIVAIVFLLGTLLDLLNLPSLVKYATDVLWIGILLMQFINKWRFATPEAEKLTKVVTTFWLLTLIGFIINMYSPLYYLWGFRNNFRFFIFFGGCIMFLREKAAEKIIRWFEILLYVNFVVSCSQFFFLGYRDDYLGGIFGVSAGCNGKQIVFLGLTTAWGAIKYLNGKKKLASFLIECICNLIIAAMAELKFYYILFVFIIAAAALITDFSYKKLVVIMVCALGFIGGTALLIKIFPKWEGIFSFDNLLKQASTASGYTGNGGLNRLTVVPIISEKFLDTTWKQLFGLGLGHCDTAAFSFLNTPFFQRYGYLHYNFFSSAFVFLETGMLGLVSYCVFFGVVYVLAKRREGSGLCNKEWGQLARIGTLMSLIFIIYNSSMRVEEAYLMYFVLALPFIDRRTEKNREVAG